MSEGVKKNCTNIKMDIRLTVGCIILLIKFSSASLVVDVPEQPIFWNYYTKHNFSV